jgi:hypothetical protein
MLVCAMHAALLRFMQPLLTQALLLSLHTALCAAYLQSTLSDTLHCSSAQLQALNTNFVCAVNLKRLPSRPNCKVLNFKNFE